MKRIFAVAIIATQSSRGCTAATALAVRAVSKEEAIGVGVVKARETWPDADGWSQHGAVTEEVPADWYGPPTPGTDKPAAAGEGE